MTENVFDAPALPLAPVKDECPKGGRHVYLTVGRYRPAVVVRECTKCGDRYEKDVS